MVKFVNFKIFMRIILKQDVELLKEYQLETALVGNLTV